MPASHLQAKQVRWRHAHTWCSGNAQQLARMRVWQFVRGQLPLMSCWRSYASWRWVWWALRQQRCSYCAIWPFSPRFCVFVRAACVVYVSQWFSHMSQYQVPHRARHCAKRTARQRQTYLPPATLVARLARSVQGFEALDQRRGESAATSLQRGVGFFQPQSINSMLIVQGRTDHRQAVPRPP